MSSEERPRDERAERHRNILEDIQEAAEEISKRHRNAPVVVIIAGSKESGIDVTLTGYANIRDGGRGRMRDRLGILQAAMQIDAMTHLAPQIVNNIIANRERVSDS